MPATNQLETPQSPTHLVRSFPEDSGDRPGSPATWESTFRSLLATEPTERRAARLERISTRYGARTRITLADGFSVEFFGRLDKTEGVRNALWQRARAAILEGAS